MSAPALVLLAQGASEPRACQIDHELRKRLQIRRPHLTIQLAFAQNGSPTPSSVFTALTQREVDEVVVVALNLTHAHALDQLSLSVTEQLDEAFPRVRIALARPIGPAAQLLNVLDDRLRAALRASRATELDALVLALGGRGDDQGNALAVRRARQWSAHHRLPCSMAYLDGSGPTAAEVVADLRSSGRRHIGVGLLAIGDAAGHRAECEAALEQGAVAVSAPLGGDERVLDLVMERYAYAAMALLDEGHAAPSLSKVAGD